MSLAVKPLGNKNNKIFIVHGHDEVAKVQMKEFLTKLGVESIILAAKTGCALWTDDLATAEIARLEFGCGRIWTQETINYFCECCSYYYRYSQV